MILADTARLERDWERLVRVSFAPLNNAMGDHVNCAYNHSRECFLGLDIATADLSSAELAEKMKSLSLGSGCGLWIVPFRGHLASGSPSAVDLILLDNDCRVLATVESFPTNITNLSDLKVASILALPAHSIYSSQTQVGDQLVVCEAEEMERRLEELAAGLGEISIEGAALLRQEPLWSGGPGVLQFENPALLRNVAGEQRNEMGLLRPEVARFRAPKNWLERWWSPDPRKAPRQPAPSLAAYYWNGGAPEAHGIRDISKSGIYIVTEERWYLGTLVLMTLQRTDGGEKIKEQSIAVQTRAVRWGHDGVGMQFLLPKRGEALISESNSSQLATLTEIDRFLRQLNEGK